MFHQQTSVETIKMIIPPIIDDNLLSTPKYFSIVSTMFTVRHYIVTVNKVSVFNI